MLLIIELTSIKIPFSAGDVASKVALVSKCPDICKGERFCESRI